MSIEGICFIVFIGLCLLHCAWYFSPKQQMKRIIETAKFYEKVTGKPFSECFNDAVATHKKIKDNSKGKLFP